MQRIHTLVAAGRVAACLAATVRAVIAAGLFVAVVAGPALSADPPRQFRDATVACDDDRRCVAYIQSDGPAPGSVLQFTRSASDRSRWTVAISTLGALADRDRAVSMSLDNGVGVTLQPSSDFAPFVRPTDFYVISQSALDRVMVRLLASASLRFSYMDIAGNPRTDRFSLRGLSGAFAEIDRIQQRIVGDRRAGPPTDLPRAEAIDREAAVAAGGVPAIVLDWHGASSRCEAAGSPALAGVEPVVGVLSPTAMLYAIPCFRREGRPIYRLYVRDSGEIGGVETLLFASYTTRFGWTGVDLLGSIAYDPAALRLTAETMDGAGCGTRGSWTYDAYAFRLERLEVAEGCAAGAAPAWTQVFPAS